MKEFITLLFRSVPNHMTKHEIIVRKGLLKVGKILKLWERIVIEMFMEMNKLKLYISSA